MRNKKVLRKSKVGECPLGAQCSAVDHPPARHAAAKPEDEHESQLLSFMAYLQGMQILS